MGKYLYTGRTANGAEVHAQIEAASAEAARNALQQQGLSDIVLHTDNFAARLYQANVVNVPDDIDPAKLIAARQHGGIGQLLWGIAKGNALFLVPLLAWNAYSWWQGEWNGGAVLSVAATTLYLLSVMWFMLPVVLFEAMQRAQLWARWDDAERWLGWLRRLNHRTRLAPHMLDFYHAKNLIGKQQEADGLALFDRYQNDPAVPQMLWLSLKASLFDDAKRREETGALMQQLTQMMPDSGQVWLDYALNQALFGDLEQARLAIANAERCELEPLMAAIAPMVHGEIAQREQDYTTAAQWFGHALLALTPYVLQTPLRPLFILLEARYAVALARLGKMRAARQAWAMAEPILARQNEHRFLDDWQAASGDSSTNRNAH